MSNNARKYSKYILYHEGKVHPSIWIRNLGFRKIIFNYNDTIGSRYGSVIGVGRRILYGNNIYLEHWGWTK